MSRTGGTVLVVDDTLPSLKLMARILAAEGYVVRPADSGQLALDSVATDPPDIILLDILMPGMDGFEVLRRLQEREESRDIPVIFLSAVTDMELRIKGLRLGAVDFVSKPCDPTELLARVQTHIELRLLRADALRQDEQLQNANEELQAADEELQVMNEELRSANDELNAEVAERRRFEEALERRLLALTLPLDDPEGLAFSDLFSLEDIQRIQDVFADATGVGSVITQPDGTPITAPSNFCELCRDVVRETEKGLANCRKSDAIIGRHNPEGPTVQVCLSGGLWDAGASISVGGRHIANWLIGQVRNEAQDEEVLLSYADEIGADREAFRVALDRVPSMPREQFEKVADALFVLAKELSLVAYQNVQQARFIAERRQAEGRLERIVVDRTAALEASLRDLRAANAVKDAFMASMSHELRTPLNSVLGFSSVLLRGMAGELNDEQSRQVSMINSAGAHLLELINRVLDLEKIEAGVMVVATCAFDVRELVTSVVEGVRPLADDKGLDLIADIADSIGIWHSDDTMLSQILYNLVGNAIKFTESGTVGIRVSIEEDVLAFSVTDTGRGVPAGEQELIFEPFHQAESADGSLVGGVGLGLSVSRRLAVLLGGTISLESSVGHGSAFTLRVPLSSEG